MKVRETSSFVDEGDIGWAYHHETPLHAQGVSPTPETEENVATRESPLPAEAPAPIHVDLDEEYLPPKGCLPVGRELSRKTRRRIKVSPRALQKGSVLCSSKLIFRRELLKRHHNYIQAEAEVESLVSSSKLTRGSLRKVLLKWDPLLINGQMLGGGWSMVIT